MKDETERYQDGPAADGGTDLFDVDVEELNENDRTGSGVPDTERSATMSEAKQEFLLEIVRRTPLLLSLQAGPADTSELLESVDMSRSTLHRAVNKLAEYDIVEESNGVYRLTNLGEVLAEEAETFGERTWAAMSFSQFLNSINGNGCEIPVEHFTDAKITERRPRQPHGTIHRIIELFNTSDNLRMFSTVISPVYVDVGYREMMDGMQIEAIFDREVIDIMLSEFPEKAHETIGTGNFTVHAHDGLPFELFIFDKKMGMAAHNENGNAEVLVECDDPSAIEWAENLYAKHLSKAEPLLLSDQ